MGKAPDEGDISIVSTIARLQASINLLQLAVEHSGVGGVLRSAVQQFLQPGLRQIGQQRKQTF